MNYFKEFKNEYLNSAYLPTVVLVVGGILTIGFDNFLLWLYCTFDWDWLPGEILSYLPFRITYWGLLFAALYQLRRKMWLQGICNLSIAILLALIRINFRFG